MVAIRLRPTFDIDVACQRLQLMKRLAAESRRVGDRSLFGMYGEYGELHLPVSQHRLWSPHLSFYLTEAGEQTKIHGRFAPRLDVWTPVWIAYLLMAFTAFFACIFGYSQWFLGETPWGFGVAALACIVIVSLYLIAAVGQQWSGDQMHCLRDQLDGILRRVSELPESD